MTHIGMERVLFTSFLGGLVGRKPSSHPLRLFLLNACIVIRLMNDNNWLRIIFEHMHVHMKYLVGIIMSKQKCRPYMPIA